MGFGDGNYQNFRKCDVQCFVSLFCCLSGDCRMLDASSNLKGMLRFLPPPLEMHDWKKKWMDAKQLSAYRQKT